MVKSTGSVVDALSKGTFDTADGAGGVRPRGPRAGLGAGAVGSSTSVWTVSITRQTSATCAQRAFWISSRPPPSTTQVTRTQEIAGSVPICGVPRRHCCIASCEHIENFVCLLALPNAPMFFTFPDDARWNAERQAVAFGVEIGEFRGVVRVPRRVFQRLLPETPTPERCVEAYHLQRTRFEKAAERKLRRRQVTEDGNVEIWPRFA